MLKQLLGLYPIYSFDSDSELVDYILPKIEKLSWFKINPISQDGPNVHLGYNDDKSTFYDEKLYNFFDECLAEVARTHFKTATLKIVDVWGVKTNFGETSVQHYHYNSIFSGVYHLNTCKRSELKFILPDTLYDKWEFCFGNDLKKQPLELKIKPEKGKFYIWPSFIHHKVMPNTESFPRYSIAVNAFINYVDSTPTSRISL